MFRNLFRNFPRLEKQIKTMADMKHFPILNSLRRSWWVKIKTRFPACIYYFGPFDTEKEAKLSQWGYIEDLFLEGAQEIDVAIEQTRPQYLTIDEEESTTFKKI